MKTPWSIAVAGCLALFALQCAQQKPDTSAADEAAIRTINPSWFKAFNSRDVNGVVALYADDAVVSPPGVPSARGKAAILELFTKEIEGATAAGISFQSAGKTDAGVSGDLGWEWGTYAATDNSGATIDKGKYMTVYARRDGKWHIIRDMWNSDAAM